MKIAKQKPESFRTAVYVTEDRYELFYSKPISLGFIDKRGPYWYTSDGVRFLNNRDALEYLVRLQEHAANPNARAGASASTPASGRSIMVKTTPTVKAKEAEPTPVITRPARTKLIKKAAAKAASPREVKEPTLGDVYKLLEKLTFTGKSKDLGKQSETE